MGLVPGSERDIMFEMWYVIWPEDDTITDTVTLPAAHIVVQTLSQNVFNVFQMFQNTIHNEICIRI